MQPTVLIVDDEPGLRKVIARALGEDGFVVATATDASDAWVKILEAEQPFDLIVVDAFMPGGGGTALVHRVRERVPNQRFLFITGRVDRDPSLGLPRDVPVLLKPFRPNGIVQAALSALQSAEGNSPVGP